MTERAGLFEYARAALVPALCIMLMSYFAYHAIAGRTGMLAWGEYKAEKQQLEAQRSSVEARKAQIEQRVALLDPRSVDPDYADELVRSHLGVIRPDEVLVPLPK